MKKISIILILVMIMSISLSACGGAGSGADQSADGGEKILKVAVGCSLTGTGAKAGAAFEEAT